MPSLSTTADNTRELIKLREDVDRLLAELSATEATWSAWLSGVSEVHRPSARNMLHYLALRRGDVRDTQARLATYGLSSLGRSEPHVEATLLAVKAAIGAMLGEGFRLPDTADQHGRQPESPLRLRTRELLGPDPVDRVARVMVTLPSEAATDPALLHRLVKRGMNVARINCAHDDSEAWGAMARHVHQAAEATGNSCLIAMDLAGPKLRTGPLEPGPRCVKLRPDRNELGQVTAPARAWLTSSDEPVDPPDPGLATVTVPGQWLCARRDGDILHLHDTRGSKRHLELTRTPQPGGFLVSVYKTTYLATGTTIEVEGIDDPVPVGELPQIEQSLLLHVGDVLTLTRDCSPAPVVPGARPRIGCTLPEIFDCAQTGQRVHLDDGKISGELVSVGPEALELRIDHAATRGSRLRAGKGINIPDADIPISAITDKDRSDLSSVIELADLVEMSFARTPSDVAELLDELSKFEDDSLGIVLKIETRQAFENLPQLLLTAMQRPRVGVMIARGDLAVECGYDRLAELQEEILWLCEAAHLPVIWATQVLEQLAQTGNPSRAEISDAAMSERAECVMLNKGPYIVDAVDALIDILCRMSDHHYKKTALMPPLRSWHSTSR